MVGVRGVSPPGGGGGGGCRGGEEELVGRLLVAIMTVVGGDCGDGGDVG